MYRGIFIGLLVKRRIGHIVIFAVQLIGGYPQSLTKALIMDDLPLPQELDWLDNIRIVYQAQNVVIGDPRLLLRRQILVQIGNGVALYADTRCVPREPLAEVGYTPAV